MKVAPQVSDDDLDAFLRQWVTRLNPALPPDQRADTFHDFVVAFLRMTEPDKSDEWIAEFGRRVRARVRWMSAP